MQRRTIVIMPLICSLFLSGCLYDTEPVETETVETEESYSFNLFGKTKKSLSLISVVRMDGTRTEYLADSIDFGSSLCAHVIEVDGKPADQTMYFSTGTDYIITKIEEE